MPKAISAANCSGACLALLALWSWLLWRDSRAQLAARCAIAMNVAIGCYVIVTAGWSESPSPLGLLFSLGAGLLAGALFAGEFACIYLGLQHTSASRLRDWFQFRRFPGVKRHWALALAPEIVMGQSNF